MEDRAISLNAVENIINKYIDGSFEWGAMLVQIKRLPSVQPQIASDCVGRKYIVHEVERPQGRWFGIEDEEMEIVGYYCSECDWGSDEETNFCPNCGARMEGNNNENSN